MRKRKKTVWVDMDGWKHIGEFLQNNPYMDFIHSLQQNDQKKTNADVGFEDHHIIPISHGGSDTFENIIRITRTQHLEAHRLLAKLTNNVVDVNTYRFMSGLGDDEFVKTFRQTGARASHIVQRKKKTGWFSSESQRERGKVSAQAPSSSVHHPEKAYLLGE